MIVKYNQRQNSSTKKRHRERAGGGKRTLRFLLLATTTATLLLLAASAGTASAAHSITSCADDVSSSGLHTVDSNINDGAASSCIDINASDVVLEGNDHSIDGLDDDATSIGVNVTGSTTLNNVTVRNLTVANWGQGVEYEDAVDGEITDIVATGNNDGVRLDDSSNGNDVTANNLSGNNNRGMSLRTSSNSNSITDNEVSGNGAFGINLIQASNNNLTGNTANGNDDDGIFIEDGTGNELTANTANDNGRYGIWIATGNSNNLTSNVALNNTVSGIYLGGISSSADSNTLVNNTARGSEYGIWISDSDNNDVSESLVEENIDGIEVAGNSFGNTFTNDTSRNNTDWDFVSEGNAADNPVTNLNIGESTSPNTTLSFEAENTTLRSVNSPPADPTDAVSIDRYFEAENLSSDSYLDVSLQYDDTGDIGSVDESTLELLRYDGAGWVEVPNSTLDTTANTVSANITTFSPFGAFGEETVGGDGDCIDRRDLGRGQEEEECPFDRDISRGGSREELDRSTGRGGGGEHRDSATSRRDRGRGSE